LTRKNSNNSKRKNQVSRSPYRLIKLNLFFIPVVIISIILSIRTLLGPLYRPYIFFISEDGPFEFATFFVYLFTFIVSLLIGNSFRKSKRKSLAISFFILACVFILIALEEISWGQRILGFETTGIFSKSTQGEVSIHDLRPFADFEDIAFIVVGLSGGLLWVIFSKLNNIKFNTFKRFFVPSWYLMSYFIPVSIFYIILNLAPPDLSSLEGIRGSFFFPKEQEPFEFFLSLGFLGFSLANYLRLRHMNIQNETL